MQEFMVNLTPWLVAAIAVLMFFMERHLKSVDDGMSTIVFMMTVLKGKEVLGKADDFGAIVEKLSEMAEEKHD